MSDRVVRFLWRDAPIRGEIVELGDAWREIVSRHAEGPAVIGLLGEVSAAAVLLVERIDRAPERTAELEAPVAGRGGELDDVDSQRGGLPRGCRLWPQSRFRQVAG